jgi:hypothetical protein
MRITYNQSELETIVTTHVFDTLPGVNPEDISNVGFNADGSLTVVIGEEVSHNDDTPPLVEKKTRRSRKNPQEAKHRPVEPEPEEEVEEIKVEETQTSTGGPNESSTPEPEEEAVAEPEAQEEVVQEEVKAEEPAEKPATKPSLFAGLKRS